MCFLTYHKCKKLKSAMVSRQTAVECSIRLNLESSMNFFIAGSTQTFEGVRTHTLTLTLNYMMCVVTERILTLASLHTVVYLQISSAALLTLCSSILTCELLMLLRILRLRLFRIRVRPSLTLRTPQHKACKCPVRVAHAIVRTYLNYHV